MITTCNKCGGLRAEPGEMFAGKGCECPLPSAPGYTASWQQHIEQQTRYAFLVGTLDGLRYRVDADTKLAIEQALQKVGEPCNVPDQRPAG